jgi:hypothetical protein
LEIISLIIVQVYLIIIIKEDYLIMVILMPIITLIIIIQEMVYFPITTIMGVYLVLIAIITI